MSKFLVKTHWTQVSDHCPLGYLFVLVTVLIISRRSKFSSVGKNHSIFCIIAVRSILIIYCHLGIHSVDLMSQLKCAIALTPGNEDSVILRQVFRCIMLSLVNQYLRQWFLENVAMTMLAI